MANYSLLIPILLSSIMGFTNYLKGMKEESSHKETTLIGGVRTFFLLSITGLVSGSLYSAGNQLYAMLVSVSAVALVMLYFYVTANKNRNASFSDELSAIIAHILSFIWVVGTMPQQVIVAAFIGTIFILEQREFLVSLKEQLNVKEFSQIIIFLVIALIVLPFLPNTTYSLHDMGIDPSFLGISNGSLEKISVLGLFNPYKLWFFVVFVSGLDIVGYLFKKAFSGSASTVVSAMIGGFVSSTSTTISLAQRSMTEKNTNELVSGALLANVVSFLQIFILIAPISLGLLTAVSPLLIWMSLVGTIIALYFIQGQKKRKNAAKAKLPEEINEDDDDFHHAEGADAPIFQLGPAIKFAILLTVVRMIATISLELVGSTGFFVTAFIASFTGIDAITITLAELFNKGGITVGTAVIAFIMINAVNLGSKLLYSALSGKKEFVLKLSVSIVAMLVVATLFQVIL